MQLKVCKSQVKGRVRIPGSKSHTIRALFFASLARGNSEIIQPLISSDARSAAEVCRAFGAEIEDLGDRLRVSGFGGVPRTPDNVVDVGNSGTTLRFAVMSAALGEGWSILTGDYQIRRRPLNPLLEAIQNLGGTAVAAKNNGMAPVMIKGRARGGMTPLDSVTSQYLSSLLVHAPLMEQDTEIQVTRLNEIPYVEMTLWWLNKQGIQYRQEDFRSFHIPGGQHYKPFKMPIPGDFSSATFFAVLAAVSGNEIVLENLDMTDPQGDKQVFSILEQMGTKVWYEAGEVHVKGAGLRGMEIDMNAIPDALPAMAVAGCFAQGETRLVNVPQARLKETDRIHVMCTELSRMGADITELEDGLVIRNSRLAGCAVSGHDDHRVVMALAVAGLCTDGETVIDSAEAMNVTFPEFAQLISDCGGCIRLSEGV